MTASNLIGLERAKLNLPDATTADDRTISALISAASEAIGAYCKRHFALTAHDELVSGSGGPRLLLREFPVYSVQSVRTRPQTVLRVENTDTSTNQRATAAVTRDGLRLLRVASGVVSVDTSVTWADNPTLADVADAVNALGSGWSAEVVGDADDFGKWPSADLYVPPSLGDGEESYGAVDCRGREAGLKLHTRELSEYSWAREGWLVRAADFPAGVDNFRVQYTAGHATIPEAVQEACASWVAILWHQTTRDPALASKAIPGAISETWKQMTDPHRPPPAVARLLAPYRRHTVGRVGG
jgi:hypothetical protein